MSQDYIWIVTEDTEEPAKTTLEGQRGFRENFQKQISDLKQVKLNPAELEKKMTDFLQVVGRLFKQAEQQAQIDQTSGKTSVMQLTEVELSVEISAEGEVKLIAGGKASGKGAIKLKFTRLETK
ncbi:hypothetical protein PN480_12460 [Dolichospermum circinale CS-1225]|uniref:Pepco domain-containing protein n=1 Tax=Dolichospermum circinale TaxID=109265 RepID=UPI000424BA93|nr:hypothetical protein [Dolichospermum circinale]MDB9454025.1 hypothetical protein [Dolichospermum circinale CS-541/06]MDB9463200.1 hypothetical protein [Dolichospermum circinale CS-541/04]MDB9522754.1 hypothetical protein [Dolichospermum circinale CS-1225]MDB9549005.1 hypothetical protein [Dolichospermum circinale CS-1031]